MTAAIIWLIGYCFTTTYEEGRRVSDSFLWKAILLPLFWPLRLGELFKKDFGKENPDA